MQYKEMLRYKDNAHMNEQNIKQKPQNKRFYFKYISFTHFAFREIARKCQS